MSLAQKHAAKKFTAQDFVLEHPFLRWFAALAVTDAVRGSPTNPNGPGDLFLGEFGASRFSLGQDDDLMPVLGIAEVDAEAVLSLKWNSAALLRRVRGRDWVALSCPDARQDTSAGTPVPVRLWIPATLGLLDGWIGVQKLPTTIRVVPTTVRRGRPEPCGNALAEIPLIFKGDYRASVEKRPKPGK